VNAGARVPGEGGGPSCERQTPHCHPEEDRLACQWHPLRVLGCEVHHQADDRHRLIVQPANAEPAHLDQAGKRRSRADQEAPVMRFEVKAIVADESGESQQTRLRRLNERERKLRLARSRRPADEQRRARQPARQRRARSESQPPSHGRQPHREACAEHYGRALRGRPNAVLGPDAAAMRLDDMLGDGEPEARILSEGLVRPVGVERSKIFSIASSGTPGRRHR